MKTTEADDPTLRPALPPRESKNSPERRGKWGGVLRVHTPVSTEQMPSVYLVSAGVEGGCGGSRRLGVVGVVGLIER